MFNKRKLWFLLSFFVVVADQASKIWVVKTIAYQSAVPVFPFFNLVNVHNYGAAFSFLANQGGWQRWFFTILALTVAVFIVTWMIKLKRHEFKLGWGLALVLGGAVGNVIDRMRLGYVVDFLDFYYQSWHYPAFNVADSAIFLGVVSLLFYSFKGEAE